MNVKQFLDNEKFKSRGNETSSAKEGIYVCYLTSERRKWVTLAIPSSTHNTLQHALLEGKIEGRRNHGRPITMWMVNITERSGCGYGEATWKTPDRNYGQQLIASDPAMAGT